MSRTSAAACLAASASALLLPAPLLHAEVTLPAVFGDHAVLQRDVPLPVWGRAQPGERVEVLLADAAGAAVARGSATADAAGAWQTRLPALPARTLPLTLTVSGSAGGAPFRSTDLLVGEVWICGGQSNMEWPLGAAMDAAKEVAAGDHPRIRCIKAPHRLAGSPRFTIDARWSVASRDSVGGFTAVGWFFARAIEERLDVPVGLVSVNWGGTHIQPWIPLGALARHPAFAAEAARMVAERAAFQRAGDHDRAVEGWENGEAWGALCDEYWCWYAARDPLWQAEAWKPGSPRSAWSACRVPGALPELGSTDGLVWVRRTVTLPPEWAGHDLEVSLGSIDDSDTTWWNGRTIGRVTCQPGTPRRYAVPRDAVQAGENEVLVALVDDAGSGGLMGDAASFWVRPAGVDGAAPLPLSGEWLLHAGTPRSAEAPRPPTPPAAQRDPALTFRAWGAMYDGMVAPFVPYAARGVIWYQGESNEDDAAGYAQLLPLLVQSWREAWGSQLAFGIVQLAAFRGESQEPVEGLWPAIREVQRRTAAEVPGCGLAVAVDVGDAGDIHPRNKQAVGRRLAAWAAARVYQQEGEWSGPILRAAERRGDSVRLTFDHASGLATRDGAPPRGFALAGPDGRFAWAEGVIEDGAVILRAAGVTEPAAVVYAWQDNPARANLVNAAGLPASPFRTQLAPPAAPAAPAR